MKIVFVSNFLNHHQAPLAEEMNKLGGVEYIFVEMEKTPESFKKTGYPDFSDRPYLLQAWKSEDDMEYAKALITNAEVVLFGGCYFDLMKLRLSHSDKLTFHVGERWLKRGYLNLLSPRLIRFVWLYHTKFRNSQYYNLCASAYFPNDNQLLHMFNNRCYKWGYFTKANNFIEGDSQPTLNDISIVSIMWCARFLDWKHPELPVMLAERLKRKGYKFCIDIFGSGPEFESIKRLISSKNLEDCVKLRGNAPNAEILKQMRMHSIFLFTSDQNEGWGAVLNEAMSSGCTVVASDKIGSVPFLIKDGVNGLVFKSKNVEDLTSRVEYLLKDSNKIGSLSIESIKTINEIWSPAKAATSLLRLVNDLSNGRDTSIKEGPCSKALPINV